MRFYEIIARDDYLGITTMLILRNVTGQMMAVSLVAVRRIA